MALPRNASEWTRPRKIFVGNLAVDVATVLKEKHTTVGLAEGADLEVDVDTDVADEGDDR